MSYRGNFGPGPAMEHNYSQRRKNTNGGFIEQTTTDDTVRIAGQLSSRAGMNHPRLHPFLNDYGMLIQSPYFMNPAPATFFDMNTEYYLEDCFTESDEDDSGKPYCGFNKNFLDREGLKQTAPSQSRLFQRGLNVAARESAKEEADRIAKELADEEQKCKDKAEKKRLKKMRQKERKRIEKLKDSEKDVMSTDAEESSKADAAQSKPEGSPPDEQCRGDLSVPAQAEDVANEVDNEEGDGSDLEELDMTSTFVSKAASIVQRKIDLKPKPEKREKKMTASNPRKESQERQSHGASQNELPSDTEDMITKSMQLANVANSLASIGDYVQAVKYFTDAIKFNPKEFRLFGNRSFCYEKMQQYEKSLTDAEISLTMNPNWIKGLYRKGRALTGLKRYGEALLVFKEVLKQDSSSSDAAQELMKVQIMQLMEMGFSREQSTNALIIHGTVEKALEVLSSIPDVIKTCQPVEEDWVVNERKKASPLPKNVAVAKANSAVKVASFKGQGQLFPVWVGNLSLSITESTLTGLFSSAGEIHSVKLLPKRRCAFVNYTKKECCEEAILKFHAMVVEGIQLTVRYPDRIHSHLGGSKAAVTAGDIFSPSGLKSTGECFLWRSKGCHLKNCIFKHVPEHKGIDRNKGKVPT
ncbi:uncharacterized protein si:dkey-33c12.4 isoform X2 [Brienomyrus brachyistius]|uniref:uncharacterized protein si:dkey-33c12.4 isoform X2 n=1 Tax=Brienomyrus brachyistius TaxID=42636 RepID=UPI0020B4599F|nr:uncharacterized protein si:dkey-33c12.4 isoform X2 [Brienomyrus brachyistius]